MTYFLEESCADVTGPKPVPPLRVKENQGLSILTLKWAFGEERDRDRDRTGRVQDVLSMKIAFFREIIRILLLGSKRTGFRCYISSIIEKGKKR